MVQSADQIIFIKHNKIREISKSFGKFTCCICRREIFENEKSFQCPKCHTYYHFKHLSIWLNIRRRCPVCLFYLNQIYSRYPKQNTRIKYVRKEKFYRCYYCNHTWEAKSSGQQLFCPECGITSCPHCKTAFGIKFVLRHIQLNNQCPKCNKYIVFESLRAKITVLE